MTDKPIFHQIIRTDNRGAYDGRPVIEAPKLPDGHFPAKLRNNRRGGLIQGRQGEIINRGPSVRPRSKGVFVDANPLQW